MNIESTKSPRSFRRRGRRGVPTGSASRPRLRRLVAEQLEERALLAGDVYLFHNTLSPNDVNDDGQVATMDALLVIGELRKSGPRSLTAVEPSPAAGEGEGQKSMYIDVNGDDFLSPMDALLVISHLRAEGQADLVSFQLRTTDLNGNPLDVVGIGGDFLLQVFVQDLRGPFFAGGTEDLSGAFSAFVDVLYNSGVVSTLPPSSTPGLNFEIEFGLGWDIQDNPPGPPSPDFASGTDIPNFAAGQGLIDEAGSIRENIFVPPGSDPILVFSIPFRAENVGQATFNSMEAGTSNFFGTSPTEPPDLLPAHAVLLFNNNPPDGNQQPIPPEDILFGSITIEVVAAVTARPDTFRVAPDSSSNLLDVLANDIVTTGGQGLVQSASTPTTAGGTVRVSDDNRFVEYTPPPGFEGVDTFTYVLTDGTDTSTTTVTVNVMPFLAQFILEVTDTSGQPINTVGENGDFLLNVFVEDLRDFFEINGEDARGLFSAYLDVLYNSGLVSTLPPATTPGLNFDIAFGPGWDTLDGNQDGVPDFASGTDIVNGDVGLIDEAGSIRETVGGTVVPTGGDPVLLFTIPYRAGTTQGQFIFQSFQAGTTGVAGNPNPANADQIVAHAVILANSDVPGENQPLAREDIIFGSAPINVVAPVAALDDVFIVLQNSSPAINPENFLDVLANDVFTSATGTKTLASVEDPPNGTAVIDDNGTPNISSDDRIAYTPDPGFLGIDTFTYVLSDGNSQQDTATVTVSVEPLTNFVRFTLTTAELDGTPTTTIGPNQDFVLQVFVQDIRPPFMVGGTDLRGVAAAYLDLLYDSTLVSTLPPSTPGFNFAVTFGPGWDVQDSQGPEGVPDGIPDFASGTDDGMGFIDELGSVRSNPFETPLGGASVLLATIPFTSGGTTGPAMFASAFADQLGHEVVLAEPGQIAGPENITFGTTTIEIIPVSPNLPVANDDSYTVVEDTVLTVTNPGRTSGNANTPPATGLVGVLNNDTDPDQPPAFARGTTLTARLVSGPSNAARFQLNPNGTFLYEPRPDFFGTDSFTYVAFDGTRASAAPAVVTITVTGVLDLLQALDDTYLANVHPSVLMVSAADGVLANDRDPERLGLTASVQTPPQGTLNLRSDGSFDYTPPAGFLGLDTFTYIARDTLGNMSSATVEILVGATPRLVSGSVYFDVNNNGVRESVERPIAGIDIVLEAVGGMDAFGRPFTPLRTTTDFDGKYSFNKSVDSGGHAEVVVILPGNYVVRQASQPAFTRDGLESICVPSGPCTVLTGSNNGSNRVSVSLLANTAAVDVNFGEIGLLPEFVSILDYLGSTPDFGITVALNNSGQQQWYSIDQFGWEDVVNVSVALNPNRTSATLTIEDTNGALFRAIIPTNNNPRFQFRGENADGLVVRFDGARSDFNFQPL